MFLLTTFDPEHKGWLHDAASIRWRGFWYTLEGGDNLKEKALGLVVWGPNGSQTAALEGLEVHAPYVGVLGTLKGSITWFYGIPVYQEMGGLPLRVIDPETGEDLQVRQDLE